MRIIAGKLRGSTLFMPSNRNTRPLKDIIKENIFNLLSHSSKISFQFEKSNVLDLYAGVGSFGLECLSRNAANVIFVEKEKEAIKILEKNIKKLNVKDFTKIIFDDVFNVIKKNKKNFFITTHHLKLDLIFCDPPFKDTNISHLIKLIAKKDLLKKNGIIVLHRHKNSKEKLTDYLKIIDERIYGSSKIIFGQPLLLLP